MSALSDDELERYSRQLVLPEWSERAQVALKRSSVLVVGAGALGSAAAQYLAAAGVGRLGLVDDEQVELSNLGRQVLHYTPDVGVPKAESAAAKLRFLNPAILVETYPARVDEQNAGVMVLGQDVVVDATDAWPTRRLINDACCAEGVALVEGAVLGLRGTVMSIRPGVSACHRCAFASDPKPEAVSTCAEAGVLGPVPGVVGAFQALEALKLLTGVGEPLLDRFLEIDGAGSRVTEVVTARRPDCPACGAPAG
jgi:molybdopterin/thiamine biosynthesis adenylyltransferase